MLIMAMQSFVANFAMTTAKVNLTKVNYHPTTKTTNSYYRYYFHDCYNCYFYSYFYGPTSYYHYTGYYYYHLTANFRNLNLTSYLRNRDYLTRR